ncbi:hypothetical protein [Methylocella sp.]|uniref:hypothetical protein n=1 Tax=Methylocella sp. TaxID=1978226 RepID=UPI003783CB92
MKATFASSSLILFAAPALAAACFDPHDAANHISERGCVCGVVLSSHYAATARSQPTYLNFDSRYPNEIFMAVIFGADRPKFGQPERLLLGKRICVEGEIRLYRSKPEIIVTDPRQFTPARHDEVDQQGTTAAVPSGKPPAPHCDDDTIQSVSDDGGVLVMASGRVYQVEPPTQRIRRCGSRPTTYWSVAI